MRLNPFKKQQAPDRKPGLVRRISGELTLTSSIKRLYSAPADGAALVRSTAEAVIDGFAKANSQVRHETFQAACERLEVRPDDLPLIHNQLLFQLYIAFFGGVVASTIMLNSFLSPHGTMVGLAAFAAGLACFANFVQASVQAFRIRKSDLVEPEEWLASPVEWFPSRLPVISGLREGDSRRHVGMRLSAIRRSRRFYFYSALMLAAAAPSLFLSHSSLVNLEYGGVAISVIFLVLAIKNSIIALQCASKSEVDLLGWLQSPACWFPKKVVVRRSPLVGAPQAVPGDASATK